MQYENDERFVASIAVLCGEEKPAGGLAWESGCTRSALQEFRITEHATGAVLLAGDRRVASTGRTPSRDRAFPAGLAVLQSAADGPSTYVLRAARGTASVVLAFAVADFLPFFEDQASLADGEVFMRDGAGHFVTPARYSVTDTPPGSQAAKPVDPASTPVSGAASTIADSTRFTACIRSMASSAAPASMRI